MQERWYMKKYIQNICISIFLIFGFCASCFASNWHQVDKKLWIDVDSMKAENGNILVWYKELNPGTWQRYNNKYIWYNMDLSRFDCVRRKYSIVEIGSYDLNGKYINGAILDSYILWINIAPDSQEEKIYNCICK